MEIYIVFNNMTVLYDLYPFSIDVYGYLTLIFAYDSHSYLCCYDILLCIVIEK